VITTEGKNHIRRYLAQYVPAIAQSVVYGIGATAEAGTDASLNFEVVRSPVNLITYDFANNKLIYKASIPDDYIGKIYEVGLYSLDQDPASGSYGSRLITTFDSGTETWVDPADGVTAPVFSATANRVGADAMLHDPAASATLTDTLRGLALDFSGNSAADTFKFAFNVANANTNSVTYRFMTDASNYYSFAITTTAQSAGYKIVELTKGSATVTGTPDWSNITEVQVLTNSKSSGASSVEHDAIRIEDKDSASLDYILVARKVLAAPVTSSDGLAQDIEFSLDITL